MSQYEQPVLSESRRRLVFQILVGAFCASTRLQVEDRFEFREIGTQNGSYIPRTTDTEAVLQGISYPVGRGSRSRSSAGVRKDAAFAAHGCGTRLGFVRQSSLRRFRCAAFSSIIFRFRIRSLRRISLELRAAWSVIEVVRDRDDAADVDARVVVDP